MSWELFTTIVDQVPNVARVVLHGVGEPMLVRDLPRMIRYLKARGTYVLFNTNGTLLTPRKRQELIDTGLDELRVSLDAAEAASFLKVRGKDLFDRIVRNVSEFTALQRADRCHHAARLAVADRPEGDGRPAARLRAPRSPDRRARRSICSASCSTTRPRPGAPRLVAVRGNARGRGSSRSRAAQALGETLGVTLDASGATEPG